VYFGTPKNPVKVEILEKLFKSLAEVWKALNSYTHSGALQLTRRFTFDEVKPNYTEHELAQALSAATAILLLCSVLLLKTMGAHQEADDTVAMRDQYHADFDDRLKKGQ
jgi:hypothetical protein